MLVKPQLKQNLWYSTTSASSWPVSSRISSKRYLQSWLGVTPAFIVPVPIALTLKGVNSLCRILSQLISTFRGEMDWSSLGLRHIQKSSRGPLKLHTWKPEELVRAPLGITNTHWIIQNYWGFNFFLNKSLIKIDATSPINTFWILKSTEFALIYRSRIWNLF